MENKNDEPPQQKSENLIIIPNKKCKFNTKDSSLQNNFKNFRSYVNSLRNKKKIKIFLK